MGPRLPALGPGDKSGCRQGTGAWGFPGWELGQAPPGRGLGLVSSGPVAVPQGPPSAAQEPWPRPPR